MHLGFASKDVFVRGVQEAGQFSGVTCMRCFFPALFVAASIPMRVDIMCAVGPAWPPLTDAGLGEGQPAHKQ